MITSKPFGTSVDGKEVLAYTLQDGENSAVILTLGGIINQINVSDKQGKRVNVVLGFDTLEGYRAEGGHIGALIGRVGNRIGGGLFQLDGKEYRLNLNDGKNHLHGGMKGFNDKVWDAAIEGDALVLTTFSEDGEENYPGNLRVEVRYSFVGGELKIEYGAVSDRKTLINLTNHAYFNLDGEGSGDICDHTLTIYSDRVTPAGEDLIPHGEFKKVEGTPFDFRAAKRIGDGIDETSDSDIRAGGGYDINYVLGEQGVWRKAAEACGAKSGICMEVFTDLPGVQFYSGNMIKGPHYQKRSGFCLETQVFPNEINCPEYSKYGSAVYDAGETYKTTTVYKFSVK